MAENRALGGALVVGTRRFQAALLMEPAALNDTGPLTTAQEAALIERVWQTVQEANDIALADAGVEKSLVLVVDRPLIRASKGTVQRAASIQQHEAQIEALYANAEVAVEDDNVTGEASLNLADAGS